MAYCSATQLVPLTKCWSLTCVIFIPLSKASGNTFNRCLQAWTFLGTSVQVGQMSMVHPLHHMLATVPLSTTLSDCLLSVLAK